MENNSRILIVDSEPQRILENSQILKAAGYEILGAQTGNECLRTARAKRPAVILISSALSDISGIDLAREIKRDPALSDAFVVLCAQAGTPASIEARALESGADATIPRDASRRELLAWVEAAFRRREGEASVRARLQRMTAAFHAIPDPVYLVDDHYRIIDCNVALTKFLGRAPSELLGQHYGAIHGASLPIPHERYDRVVLDRRTETVVLPVHDRWLRVTIIPLVNEDDRVAGTLHVLRDVTEQRRENEELREATAALEQTTDQLREEMDGRAEAEAALSQAHTRLEKQAAENLASMTKIQHLERSLDKLEKGAGAERMEAIAGLAGGSSRQFNELLTSILGSAELALSRMETSYPGHDELSAIQQAARRTAEWTRRLANLHRSSLPAAGPVDLNELVTEQSRVLERIAGGGVTVEFNLAAGLDPVQGEARLLEHALLNLAQHARESMPKGGTWRVATEAVKLSKSRAKDIAGARAGSHVRLTAADTGPGRKPEELEHLFEPYHEAGGASQDDPLGLAEVYGIVRQHNGWIEVDSTPGEGTRLAIYLPVFRAPDE